MEKRFYVDTSVWRDYFEDRSDSMRPLGEFAFRFLKGCLDNRVEILVSDLVIIELRNSLSENQVAEIFSPFEAVIVRVAATKPQYVVATGEWVRLGKMFPLNDVFHAIIAKGSRAVVVTRDRHFESLGHIAASAKPEDVIFS